MTNWFVVLNGKVGRGRTKDEILASLSDEFKEKHRDRLAAKILEHERLYPKPWNAWCPCVNGVHGFGYTPEEAIRDFEEKMKLP